MLVTAAWLLAVAALGSGGLPAVQSTSVSVWTDRETPYDPGAPVHVSFRVDRPAHITALLIDTEGRVRVLYPRTPWADNRADAGRATEIARRSGGPTFTAGSAAGMGYIFVVASPFPFDYADLTRGDYWDYHLIPDGRIRGDPYVALTDIAERIAPRGAYAYDIASYDVGGPHEYPRFVCAQCHTSRRTAGWDEYESVCSRFQLVIYDDPIYYPFRYRGNHQVAVTRPLHPGPRFIFRDAVSGSESVTRRRGRPDAADRRRIRGLSPARPLVERHPADNGRRPSRERGRDEPITGRATPPSRDRERPRDEPTPGRATPPSRERERPREQPIPPSRERERAREQPAPGRATPPSRERERPRDEPAPRRVTPPSRAPEGRRRAAPAPSRRERRDAGRPTPWRR